MPEPARFLKMKIKSYILFYLLIGFLALSRFIYLGTVPGLHGDEALYGIKTCFMMQKPFTLIGFNSYTGPIISYLRLPFYYLTGISIFSARLPIVILSLATIFYVYKLLKETYNNSTGIIGALLFLAIPWSFIDSRFADETHTTLVFFAICGLYYLNADKKILNRVLAALFLGMGFFNHMIFMIVPCSYFAYFLIKNKFKIKLDKPNLLFFVIFLSFLILRMGLALKYQFFSAEGSGINYDIYQAINKDVIPKFMSLGPYFLNMLDGNAFYERMTGRVLFYVIPLNTFLFIASFLFLIFRYKYNPEFKDKDRMFVCIFILNYIINAVFLMQFALRYFLVTLMFATILMAIFIGTSRIRDLFRVILIALVIVANCSYLWFNYIYSFRQTGGSVHSFLAGNFIENSDGFIDTKILYDYLKKKDIRYILVPENYPRWQLIFLDLKEKRLDIKARPENISASRVYFISYKEYKSPDMYNISKGYSVSKENTGLDNYQIFLLKK